MINSEFRKIIDHLINNFEDENYNLFKKMNIDN